MSAILEIPEVRQRLSPLSVEEYHRLIKVGILNEYDRCELLEERIVPHERRSPPHEWPVISGLPNEG